MMKTWEILKRIDEDKNEMIGKRFRQIGGLVTEEFGIGDIAIVTQYFGITSLGAEKFSKIRIDINGFEEWERVEEKYYLQDAFVARTTINRSYLNYRLTTKSFLLSNNYISPNYQTQFTDEDIERLNIPSKYKKIKVEED